MSINPLDWVRGIVAPVSRIFEKREERKKAVQTAQKKIEQANADTQNSLQLSDAEWESLNLSTQQQSWKDEYVTIIVTLPIPLLFLGCIYFAVTGDSKFLDGVNMAIANLAALGMDWDKLITMVVMAAIGLKFWRA